MNNSNQSKEDYLERFLMLEEKGMKEIRAIDIANSFAFSRASVSVAMKSLIEEGYITSDKHQHLSLTAKGRKTANSVYQKHKVISSFLISIGVNENIALEDACKLEHDISKESFEALKKYIDEQSK